MLENVNFNHFGTCILTSIIMRAENSRGVGQDIAIHNFLQYQAKSTDIVSQEGTSRNRIRTLQMELLDLPGSVQNKGTWQTPHAQTPQVHPRTFHSPGGG